MITMKITNVIAKAEISGFDKNIILDYMNNAEYRPNGFPAICIPADNGAKISLFDSGKITSKGTTSTDSAIQSINDFIKKIKKLKQMKMVSITSDPQISLIVSHVSFGKIIDIAQLKGTPQFKKEVKRFHSIQLVFPHGVNVLAYDNSLIVNGRDISDMMSVIKNLEKYTLKEKQ